MAGCSTVPVHLVSRDCTALKWSIGEHGPLLGLEDGLNALAPPALPEAGTAQLAMCLQSTVTTQQSLRCSTNGNRHAALVGSSRKAASIWPVQASVQHQPQPRQDYSSPAAPCTSATAKSHLVSSLNQNAASYRQLGSIYADAQTMPIMLAAWQGHTACKPACNTDLYMMPPEAPCCSAEQNVQQSPACWHTESEHSMDEPSRWLGTELSKLAIPATVAVGHDHIPSDVLTVSGMARNSALQPCNPHSSPTAMAVEMVEVVATPCALPANTLPAATATLPSWVAMAHKLANALIASTASGMHHQQQYSTSSPAGLRQQQLQAILQCDSLLELLDLWQQQKRRLLPGHMAALSLRAAQLRVQHQFKNISTGRAMQVTARLQMQVADAIQVELCTAHELQMLLQSWFYTQLQPRSQLLQDVVSLLKWGHAANRPKYDTAVTEQLHGTHQDMQSLAPQSQKQRGLLTAVGIDELGAILPALRSMGALDDELVALAAKQVMVAPTKECSFQAIARVVHELATSGWAAPQQYHTLAKLACRQLHSVQNPEHLVWLLCAFTSTGDSHQGLLRAAADVLCALEKPMLAFQWVRVAHVYAASRMPHELLFEKISQEVANATKGNLDLETLVKLVSAYAHLYGKDGWNHDRMFNKVLGDFQQQMTQLQKRLWPEGVKHKVAKGRKPPLFGCVANSSGPPTGPAVKHASDTVERSQRLPAMSWQEAAHIMQCIAQLLRDLATLRVRCDAELMLLASNRACRLAELCIASNEAAAWHQVATTLDAFASQRVTAPELHRTSEVVLSEVIQCLEQHQHFNMLAGDSRLSSSCQSDVFNESSAALESDVNSIDTADLSSIVSGLDQGSTIAPDLSHHTTESLTSTFMLLLSFEARFPARHWSHPKIATPISSQQAMTRLNRSHQWGYAPHFPPLPLPVEKLVKQQPALLDGLGAHRPYRQLCGLLHGLSVLQLTEPMWPVVQAVLQQLSAAPIDRDVTLPRNVPGQFLRGLLGAADFLGGAQHQAQSHSAHELPRSVHAAHAATKSNQPGNAATPISVRDSGVLQSSDLAMLYSGYVGALQAGLPEHFQTALGNDDMLWAARAAWKQQQWSIGVRQQEVARVLDDMCMPAAQLPTAAMQPQYASLLDDIPKRCLCYQEPHTVFVEVVPDRHLDLLQGSPLGHVHAKQQLLRHCGIVYVAVPEGLWLTAGSSDNHAGPAFGRHDLPASAAKRQHEHEGKPLGHAGRPLPRRGLKMAPPPTDQAGLLSRLLRDACSAQKLPPPALAP